MTERMKQVPNIITGLRIAGSVALLFFAPLSAAFYVLYLLCGLTDVFDGYLARKTGTVSKTGAILDSVADLVFVAAALYVFIPVIPFKLWMVYWTLAIALVRFVSLAVGYVRYRTFAWLHTTANKATGLVLFCFPFYYPLIGLTASAALILVLASLSALEELVINTTAVSLNRDRKTLFQK